MKLKNILLLVALTGFSTHNLAQPTGTVRIESNDISFGSDSVVTISPSNITVTMELRSAREDEASMLNSHLDAQTRAFEALDAMGVTYQGQVESEFDISKNTSFVRRRETFTVISSLSAVALTDEQLVNVASLIDNSDELTFVDYSVNYAPEDSVEEIQKNVLNGLISQSQTYQQEQNTTLTPKGISKMDIVSEPFGEDIVDELLEDNDYPTDTNFSDSNIDIIGIRHQISAELTFR